MRTPIDVYRQADMEVAMHGENHLWVKACLGAEIVKEFYQDKLALEELTGGIIRGGAYAYGCYNEETLSVLKTLGLSYFRTTQETGGFDIPTDWLRVPMTCRHKDANLFTILEKFLAEQPNKPYAYVPRLFLLMGHSWEFKQDDNWCVIEEFGARLAERNDVWHATNIEIYDYVQAYRNLIFSANGDKILNNSATNVYLLIDGKNILAKAGQTTTIA